MIAADTDGEVWVLALDRPDKANALTGAMLHSLVSHVEAAARERPAALILTGRGKVFSAGADLAEARAGLALDPVWERLSGAIAALPFPTVAALNGTLAGGAFGMVLACDMRVAVPGAGFFYPVMSLGFLPQPSDPGRLARLVGHGRASQILMAGERIGAEEARAWGLVDKVAEDPLAEAHRLCEAACKATPEHRAGIKALLA
jgi:enoyl-CoA hydratase/carnithine racemase